jgi:eukaryotic-like serine/threonine-protein kinase
MVAQMPESRDKAPPLPGEGASTVRADRELVAGPLSPSVLDPALIIDGRYRVESEIGRGGMGVVYLARDAWLDRQVALKVIAASWASDARATKSFNKEAKALASIRSQHVVQVYTFGPHEGSYFFAMEYVHGRSLRAIIAEHKQHNATIPVHRTLEILSKIANGIGAVHAKDTIHRDVKPANIVIEDDTARPVLVDFGLAAPGDDPSQAIAMGTPQYMAPEQAGLLTGTPVSPRTDVYAFGVTAFEMLTGRLPFESTDHAQLMRQHARKTPPLVSSIKPDLKSFDPVIARALAKDPSERYEGCTDMASALVTAGERWRTGRLTPPPPPRSVRSSSTTRVLVVDHDATFRKLAAQAAVNAFYHYWPERRVIVAGVASGEEALDRAESDAPELVLLDSDMPGLDAAETLSRLRAVPGGDQIRVVVLSSRVGTEDRWRFSVLGVSDFVKKSSEFQPLVESILAIAKRSGWREKSEGGSPG